MAKNPVKRLGAALSDRFIGVWQLLSETSSFLSRTQDFFQYEKQLRMWRLDLQSKSNDVDTAKRVREELVLLRKTLRLQGYDLSLAKEQLLFDSFRNDACVRDGFRRLVIFFTDTNVYWMTGEDNHITIADYLEDRLRSGLDRDRTGPVRERHYLWYKRHAHILILSGSDTETKDDFERLKARGGVHSLQLLGKLKSLK